MEGEQATYSEIESVFQAPDPKPDPDLPACPTFTCKSGQSSCRKRVTHDLVSTTVLSDICKSSEACEADDKGTYSCVSQDVFTDNRGRWSYPGEKCKKDSYCVKYTLNANKDGGLKKENILCDKEITCEGQKAGDKCSGDAQCVAGNYCEIDSKSTEEYRGKCTKLKAPGAACVEATECQNHLLCYQKVCTELYKEEGVIKEYNPAMCKSTFAIVVAGATEKDPSTYKCQKIKFSGDVDKKDKTKVCKKDSDCTYQDESNATVKIQGSCQCGNNSKPERYCALPYVGYESAFDDYVKQQLAYVTDAKDETNTKYRYEPLNAVRSSDKVQAASRKATAYVTWFKADSCALKVLSSGYIQISAIVLLILAFIF
jgi:hypothetical protein